jgi:hypothetical protein
MINIKNPKKHKIEIGNTEAEKIRQRVKELGINYTILSDKADIDYRYLTKIISINKESKINVDKSRIDKILSTLGVSPSYIFGKKIPKFYQEGNYLLNQIKEWTHALFNLKKDDKKDQDNQASSYEHVINNEVFKKIFVFGKTPIIKYISNNYSSVKQFLEENASFSIIPIHGYWRSFTTSPTEIKNCYLVFVIKPKKQFSCFKIAYTLQSQINFGLAIPNKIRIIYGEIECKHDHIAVTQHYNSPSHYKVKKTDEITVITWIDKVEHDFIIMSDDDFELVINKKDIKTKSEVKAIFYNLNAVVFQKHSYFHREKIGDIGDDVSFFWRNENFLDFNPEIKNKL